MSALFFSGADSSCDEFGRSGFIPYKVVLWGHRVVSC